MTNHWLEQKSLPVVAINAMGEVLNAHEIDFSERLSSDSGADGWSKRWANACLKEQDAFSLGNELCWGEVEAIKFPGSWGRSDVIYFRCVPTTTRKRFGRSPWMSTIKKPTEEQA